IAPAGNANAVRIDGQCLHDFLNAREDIAEIASTKVFDISLRKGCSLAEAPTWIGKQHEIPLMREQRNTKKGLRPGRPRRPSRTAMDLDDQRIATLRIVRAWIQEPTLYSHPVAGPVQALGFAPLWVELRVDMGQLFPVAE